MNNQDVPFDFRENFLQALFVAIYVVVYGMENTNSKLKRDFKSSI